MHREDATKSNIALVCRAARAYVRHASSLSYAGLRELQPAPWASVKLGAAGIAYALSRPGARRLRLQDLAAAKRLLAETNSRLAERGAFLETPPSWSASEACASLYFGRLGVELVSELVPRNDRLATVSQSLHNARRVSRKSELLFGVAGLLRGTTFIARARPATDAKDRAAALAEEILGRALGVDGWARAPRLSFAHGRAGVFYSLLDWSLDAGRTLPGSFFDELTRLMSDVDRERGMGASVSARKRGLARSWCNGAAGMTMLWVRAFEYTGEARYRVRARTCARFLLQETRGEGGGLCCGLGGRAFALLALDRIDPAGGWDAHASRMALDSAVSMVEHPGPWPNALFDGFPGIVCLAIELCLPRGKRAGFPLVGV